MFLFHCRNFFDEDEKKKGPTDILYQSFSDCDAYSVVVTNCEQSINPSTLSPKLFSYNSDKSLKKAHKGNGYIGNYAEKSDYSGVYGILPKPVMQFATKQIVYKDLSMEKKGPLNAFKSFINEHPTCVAWHNGTIEDACKINGFHLHAVIVCEQELCRFHPWRTVRQKLENFGIVVRTQRIKNLRAIMAHIAERPRLIMGVNNVYLARYGKEGIDRKLQMDDPEQFVNDDKMPAMKDALETDFMSDLLGWQQTTAVSDNDDDSDGSIKVEDIFFAATPMPDAPVTGQQPHKSRFVDLVANKATEKTKALPATKTSEKVGILKDLCGRYETRDQTELLHKIMENSTDDLKQWRILRTAPNFNVIWQTTMEEFKGEEIVNKVSYLDQYIEKMNKLDQSPYMSVPETARFWKQWCGFQGLNSDMILHEMFQVLGKHLSKINTFMFCGDSDAGKTYWTKPLIIPDRAGQVITSADFMWQQCVDKDIISVPELTLQKYDQVEGFKKIAERLPTQVNIKNKPAATLARTPMIVTVNNVPWKFFNDEPDVLPYCQEISMG